MAKGNNLTHVQDQIFTLVRKAQYNFGKMDRGILFHATDYVSECVRNIFYAKMNPREGLDTKTMSIFWAGSAIHNACAISPDEKNNEHHMTYDIVNDKAVSADNPIDKTRLFDYISGTMDDLVEVKDGNKKEWCIVDKKTWRSRGFRKSSPSNNHVDQINIYKVMLKADQGIDAKYGSVVYFDMWQDGYEKPQVMPFELETVEKTRAKLLIIKQQLEDANKTGKLPDRKIHWKCNGYCPYAERCFNEDEVEKGAIKFVAHV